LTARYVPQRPKETVSPPRCSHSATLVELAASEPFEQRASAERVGLRLDCSLQADDFRID
jgi:hypothetical protein